MVTREEIKDLVIRFDWLECDPPVYKDVIDTIRKWARANSIAIE